MFEIDLNDSDLNKRVQRYLAYSLALVVISIVCPFFALTGWLMPAADKPEIWFQRSGAVTTIFALFSGAGTAAVLGALIPRGLTDLKLEVARLRFGVKFQVVERVAFWATVVGTFIWGYGDLVYLWAHGR